MILFYPNTSHRSSSGMRLRVLPLSHFIRYPTGSTPTMVPSVPTGIGSGSSIWISLTLLPIMGLWVSVLKKFILVLFDTSNVAFYSALKKWIMKFFLSPGPTEYLLPRQPPRDISLWFRGLGRGVFHPSGDRASGNSSCLLWGNLKPIRLPY